MGQYASRIKQATKNSEEYAYVQDRMLASANATYRSVQETRESFIQLSPVLREMGLTLGQSVDVIDIFSGLLVVNAASAEKAKGAQDALAKSLQKGKIDADAWMSIYSTLDIIAASSGKSATEIRKLGAEGKLGIEMLVKALADGSSKVAGQVKEMPTTVRDAMQSVVSATQEYVGWSNQTHGITATHGASPCRKPDLHKARAVLAGIAMLAGMVGGGAGIGYWAGVERMSGMLAEDRSDHLDEIARLQDANRIALNALSRRVERAADRSVMAADTATTAAEATQAAATTAGKAAKAAGVSEHECKAINTTIQRANERITREGSR